jgi:uncharacterized membrane protein
MNWFKIKFRFDWRAVLAGLFAAVVVGALFRDSVEAGYGIITLAAFVAGYFLFLQFVEE